VVAAAQEDTSQAQAQKAGIGRKHLVVTEIKEQIILG
jgi:hypothetical protein